MIESALYSMSTNDLFCVIPIDDELKIFACKISEAVKKTKFVDKGQESTFACDVNILIDNRFIRQTVDLNHLFLTQQEAEDGLVAIISDAIVELDRKKEKLNAQKKQ